METMEMEALKRLRMRNRCRMIGETMLALGILPHLNGYRPLCEAIRVVMQADRTARIRYSDVVKWTEELFGLKDADHAMRDAIRTGFLNEVEEQRAMFPFTKRPSNAEFIWTVAEALRDRDALTGPFFP